MAIVVVYMAHRVRGDIDLNLYRAKLWYRYLVEVHNLTVIANWIVNVEVFDDNNPDHRRIGMENNKKQIKLCDALYLVGPAISQGMYEEAAFACSIGRPVADFTYLGLTLPPPTRIVGKLWSP